MFDFIINPMARRGRGIEEVEKALRILDERNISYNTHRTKCRKHATEIAYDLTLNGADTIVSCGGDGTIHEIINGIIKARLKLEKDGKPFVTNLALLPCGTGNDFMRSAGLPTDTEAAVEIMLKGNPKPCDAIKVNDVYEITFACRGIDVDIVNLVNASKHKTESSYLKKALICIFKRVNYDFGMIIDGKEINERGVIAAVLNGGQLASGMRFCPDAKIDDGYLDLIFVRYANPIKLLIGMSKLSGDNFIDGDIVKRYKAKKVSLTVNQQPIDIDGELYDQKKFDAEIAPNVLNLIR